MTTITFKKGDLFEEAAGIYDLFIYCGHPGMSFQIKYSALARKFPILKQYPNPFNKGPITLENGKKLLFIEAEFMSDKDLRQNLVQWLTYAVQEGIKTIGFTGVRDSAKQDSPDQTLDNLIQLDDRRVRLIVDIIKEFLSSHRDQITEIVLISISDNFTRNFPKAIHVP